MSTRRKFRFIREIARGGFGTVYLAEMITGDDFSTVVAVKLLHKQWIRSLLIKKTPDNLLKKGRPKKKNSAGKSQPIDLTVPFKNFVLIIN